MSLSPPAGSFIPGVTPSVGTPQAGVVGLPAPRAFVMPPHVIAAPEDIVRVRATGSNAPLNDSNQNFVSSDDQSRVIVPLVQALMPNTLVIEHNEGETFIHHMGGVPVMYMRSRASYPDGDCPRVAYVQGTLDKIIVDQDAPGGKRIQTFSMFESIGALAHSWTPGKTHLVTTDIGNDILQLTWE